MTTRTFRRIVAAIVLPLGPLAVALLRAVMPYYTSDSSAEMITHTAAAPGRQDVVLWLTLVIAVTLIPSALAGARLAQRRAPVLALLTVGLSVPAFAALLFSTTDPALRVLSGPGVEPATAIKVLDGINNVAPVAIAGTLFVVGHILGLILLGAALWRAKAIPAWAAIAVMISQPLHLTFAVIVPNHLLDALAWGLAALGLALASVRVLKTSDDNWDLGAS
jgi:hypothetical protein